MVELKNCIEYWESALFHHKFLMSPSVRVMVESTIGHLKELQQLQEATERRATEISGCKKYAPKLL